jgi:sialate O-acetylesterase
MKNGIFLKNSLVLAMCFLSLMLQAQVRPHHIFDSNMVLQRDKPIRIWGWAAPGEKVTVWFAGQEKAVAADQNGEWSLYLDPFTANSRPQEMKISGRNNRVVFNNVLVGDVWIVGGQSNMEFDLARIFHGDAEILSAHYPNLRLMTMPSSAGLEPKRDFGRINEYDGWYDRYDKKGYWFTTTPETVPTFSGIGYLFGRRIHMASQVPVGLIDVSLGGTTVEAWLSPETLAASPENAPLLKQWNDKVAAYDPTGSSPSPALDRNFPGSSYKGMVALIAGLSVKGIIFHQGYNNALEDARPNLYAQNFKTLITDWRKTFNDQNLPFGIIELSAGGEPQTPENFEIRMIDPAPSIREGQFKAYQDVPNTGFVCCYDQQVNWYHPQKKVEAAERMARWALSAIYGFDLKWEPALCSGIERMNDRIIVTFNKEVKTSDDRPIEGFAVAGDDRHFFPAKAEFMKKLNEEGKEVDDKNKIQVRNDLVTGPVEVRYAWARNPLGNLVSLECPVIPVPLFRSDRWDYPEAPWSNEEYQVHRNSMRMLRQQAAGLARQRLALQAEKVQNEK